VQTAATPALPPKTLAQNNRELVKENFPNAKLPAENKPAQAAASAAQNPVVFSTQDKKAAATKDLLTKSESGAQATKPTPVSPNKKRQIRVQVAAMTSKDAAQDAWKKIHHLHTDLFSGLKPVIEEVDLGKRGIFYRLQIGNFFNQIEAEEFCGKYVAKTKKNKSDCIIVE
jgi:cell division septation protein DedD